MSLAGVKTISGVKIDINDGGGVVSRSYIAATVRAEIVKKGESWITADGTRHNNVRHQWIKFTIEGEQVDQISNTANLRDPVEIGQDLQDAGGYTVELYPDNDQAQKFTVIAEGVSNDELISEFTDLVRSNTERIVCITESPVDRADIDWFARY